MEISKQNALRVLKSGLPWLELSLGIDAERAWLEVSKLRDELVTHRSISGWKSICLHGISPTHTEHAASYGYSHERDAPHCWTRASNACPYVVSVIKSLAFSELYRVRVMVLAPHCVIPAHRDCSVHCLSSINVALNNPNNCDFVVEGHGPVPFAPGKAIMIDLANVHSVKNNSDLERYHLIIQGILDLSNHGLQELLVKGYLRNVDCHSLRM